LLLSRKRPAGTPPSTFLFLLIYFSNSPGPMKVPSPENRRAVEARHPTRPDAFPTEKSCGASEARHRADVRQRAEELIYTGRRLRLSTLERVKIAPRSPPSNPVFSCLFAKYKGSGLRKEKRRSEATFLSRSGGKGQMLSGVLGLVTTWKSAPAVIDGPGAARHRSAGDFQGSQAAGSIRNRGTAVGSRQTPRCTPFFRRA